MNRYIEILILKYKNPFINLLDQSCVEIGDIKIEKYYFFNKKIEMSY